MPKLANGFVLNENVDQSKVAKNVPALWPFYLPCGLSTFGHNIEPNNNERNQKRYGYGNIR